MSFNRTFLHFRNIFTTTFNENRRRFFFVNVVTSKQVGSLKNPLHIISEGPVFRSLNQVCNPSRARARLFQLRRGFVVMIKDAFLPLYLSLIRPILEYVIQAVSPYLQKDIVLTERLQKLATRLVKRL